MCDDISKREKPISSLMLPTGDNQFSSRILIYCGTQSISSVRGTCPHVPRHPADEDICRAQEYELIAWVILPDHWHCIIDPLEKDVASLMKRIKLSFTAGYLKRLGFRSGRTWHNRYWDHVIRNQEDMNRHLDYIHYNPVKHRLATSAMEYPHSSFRQFVDSGLYDSTWGIVDSPTMIGDFGE